MRDKYQATGTPFLSGFEKCQNGNNVHMNFILSNGDRSKQRDKYAPTKYTFMMPADAHNKIRSVTIYHDGYIFGFSFFDKDGDLLYKIGDTTDLKLKKETVEIAENERIIGVKANLYSR